MEVTPDGKIVWEYTDLAHHHDAQWLDNGNLLYSVVEPMPKDVADQIVGGHTKNLPENSIMYGDVVKEVNREGKVVWLWRSWEHLNISDFPMHSFFERTHWPYINGLWLARGDVVLMSLRTTSGVIGTNKSSGKVVLHIGNEFVSQQHSPVELENGNILVFDNGNFRNEEAIPYSRIIEINPTSRDIEWQYSDEVGPAFFSAYQGAAQRLSNGNTHITESVTGRLFEVTKFGEIVWEYVIPYFGEYTDPTISEYVRGRHNSVFRTYRYSKSQLPWL